MKPADCIELGHGRWIPKHAISFEAIRASGPGGQHVNKVATAVRMRVVLEHIKGLNAESRQRLVALLGKREKEGGLRCFDRVRLVLHRPTAGPPSSGLLILCTPPQLRHLSESNSPHPIFVRKRLSDKNTTARRKDNAENVISKCDPWRYPTEFRRSVQPQFDPFEPHQSCEPSRQPLPILPSPLRRT